MHMFTSMGRSTSLTWKFKTLWMSFALWMHPTPIETEVRREASCIS